MSHIRHIAAGVIAIFPSLAYAATTPPALSHVQASGAEVIPEQAEHGMQTYIARGRGHFMVFDLTPDGQAIVSGALLQIPVHELLASGSARITELSNQHGLRSFLLRTGDRFQVFYATPDEQRVIPGTMWDASGHNVTRDQLASLPDMKPTVEIKDDPQVMVDGQGKESDPLELVSNTTSGFIGSDHAPTAWMFVDPQCSFSIRAMQQLHPAIAAGKLRLAVIPLSILDREDNGLSTRRALAMVGRPPSEIVNAWEQGAVDTPPDQKADSKLQANMAAATALQLKGTPTFFWQRKDGTIGRHDGAPTSPEALLNEMSAPA